MKERIRIVTRHSNFDFRAVGAIHPRARDNLGLWFGYQFPIEMSVPILIGRCLGSLMASRIILHSSMLKGGTYHPRCTEMAIGMRQNQYTGLEKDKWRVWKTTRQEADRFLEAYERYIMPMEKSPPSAKFELTAILMLYNQFQWAGAPKSKLIVGAGEYAVMK